MFPGGHAPHDLAVAYPPKISEPQFRIDADLANTFWCQSEVPSQSSQFFSCGHPLYNLSVAFLTGILPSSSMGHMSEISL